MDHTSHRRLWHLEEESHQVQELYRRKLAAADVVILSTGERCIPSSTTNICGSGVCEAVATVDGSTSTDYYCAEANKACPNDCSGSGTCTS